MNDKSWKVKTIIIGTVIGALAGAASGFLLVKRAESENKQPKLTASEGVQVGLGILGMLRQIAGFGSEGK
jgi:gas vesicle protein